MPFWGIEIAHNLALLLSLGLLFCQVRRWLPQTRRKNSLLLGLASGVLGIFSMATAFVHWPGVMFDSRTIVIVIASLYGGGWSGAVAMTMTGAYCWLLGGPALTADLAVILTVGAAGILARWLICRFNWPPTLRQLWLAGLAAHLPGWVCLLQLSEPVRAIPPGSIAVPFLVVYPLAVVVSGMIITGEERWFSNMSRLQHAEWLFSEAQKVNRFGSWEYRLETDCLRATPLFYELLGIRDAARSLSLHDFFGRLHKEDWDIIRLSFDEAIRGESDIDVQGRLLTDDGRDVWIRIIGKPIVVKERVTQLVGNLIDITRRKTGELQLQASEERLQAIIDHAPALICVCDLEGRINLANHRLEAIGIAGGPVIGRSLYELKPRAGAVEQWRNDMVALQAGERIEFEETLRHADGTERTYLVHKFLLRSATNRPDTIGYIATDISELRSMLTEQQQLANELRRKNSELERFSYVVSHDLKAPLLTIGSYATLLREDLAVGITGQALQDLGRIRQAVDKMRQLIDDLLQYSRIGQATGEPVDVDLNEVVAEVLLLLSGEIGRAGAEIIPATDLPVVRGDAVRLRQVLQNLVQNALKYRDLDRPLVVAIDGSLGWDGSTLVSVRDNGRGIAGKDQGRIFELFERAGEESEGTGIGLALSRRIMEMHGGDLRVESVGPGAGSRFVMHFPVPQATAGCAMRGEVVSVTSARSADMGGHDE